MFIIVTSSMGHMTRVKWHASITSNSRKLKYRTIVSNKCTSYQNNFYYPSEKEHIMYTYLGTEASTRLHSLYCVHRSSQWQQHIETLQCGLKKEYENDKKYQNGFQGLLKHA